MATTLCVPNEINLSAEPELTDDARRLQTVAVLCAVELRAHVTTAADLRRAKDIICDKQRAATEFFASIAKPLDTLTPLDVRDWHTRLLARFEKLDRLSRA